ncbi:MAG: SPOR domain-containing protein [Bacteroidia bacterium]|nr:SPOR domain-containing protein [Bacteroidia bacterium]MDW8236473.1 SPOR domain-containing protein [Bacteroidia bacterium]
MSLLQVLAAQERWEALRPMYSFSPPVTAEKPIDTFSLVPIQVIWEVSPALRNLYDKVLQNFRTATTLPGYRIQVLVTLSRSVADSMRFSLLENFPDQGVYMFYEAPAYKVRIGDFLDRREAESWIERHKKIFPDAFVVPDKVLRL